MDNKKTAARTAIQNVFNRDYVLSFLAFFSFLCAFHALTPTLPIYLDMLGSGKAEVGVLVGTIGISSLVSRFLVGRVLLRYSERRVMIWGAALFALSFLALIFFRPFWPLFIVRLVQGISFASVDTSAVAYGIKIIPPAYRSRAISYFLLAPPLASGTAAASGVFVLNQWGFTVLLLACAGLCMCAFFISCKLKNPGTAKPAVVSPVKKRFPVEHRIIAPAVVNFLYFFCWGAVIAFFPLYAVKCGVSNPGLFFSANAVMLIISRLLGGRVFDTYGKEKTIIITAFILLADLVILSFSNTLPLFIIVGLVWGVGSAFFIPVTMSYALEYAGSSDGTTVSTYQAFMDLGLALGPAVAGIFVSLMGYQALFLCLGIVCLVNIGFFQFYVRKRGRRITV
ncbi:MAG: MFS transporter [Spirochaetes bacterium]|nr:MFS transporter [Spirochaetota bacterium]